MNHPQIKLHYYQIELVKKLSVNPHMKFNDLMIDGLESEHMNYHLKKLLETGFVTKQRTQYTLTDIGKDFSNLLDEQTDLVEKQPKTSIIIWGVRQNLDGQIEHLLNRRLRQPYYGKVGRVTGKVRFGETLEQAAARELYEETGLEAKSYILEKIYHKMRQREDGQWVQDVIFYIFFVSDFTGQLIHKTPYQENFWISKQEVYQQTDLDLYDDFEIDDRIKPKPLIFIENRNIAQGY